MTLFISGNIHQGTEIFSVHSGGKQCAVMSLSALLTAHNKPLIIEWSNTTLNNVVLQGDKMYLEALNNGLIVPDPGVEHLSIDNLSTVFCVSCCMNNMSPNSFFYEICKPLFVTDLIQTQNVNKSPIVVPQTISDLPIVVEPIEAQNTLDCLVSPNY
jgi:hypothetical protein